MSSGTTARDQASMETLMKAMATALGLPVQADWVPGVAQQLAATLAMADVLEKETWDDDAQAAPVFRL